VPTRYEYYITGEDSWAGFTGDHWQAQMFQSSIAHKITSVKLLLSRATTYTPGTVTVSIRDTVGLVPTTGPDLCSGTIDGASLVFGNAVGAGDWYEITFGTGYDLLANTKYAIVVRCAGAGVLDWYADASSPTYTWRRAYDLTGAGTTWQSDQTWAFLFEEWETILIGYIWVEGTGLHYGAEDQERVITGADTGSNGAAGYLWVEGTYLHYIDENGDERRQEGTAEGATGQTAGHIWIESTKLRYIDANGDERYIEGTVV